MGQAALGDCMEPRARRRDGGIMQQEGQVFQQPIGQKPAKKVGGNPPSHCRPTKALLIGINYEGSSAALKGCQNDATDMCDLLTRQYGYNPGNIRTLLDRPGSEFPTRVNIMQSVKWLIEGAQEGDCLFFHFSGHGGQQEDPECHEDDCMNETLIPCDYERAGQIIDDEMFEVMIRHLPWGVKITAVMDCCHSGTGLDLPHTLETNNWGQSSWRCDVNPCHSEGHVCLISGCCDNQCSADIQGMYRRSRGALTEAYIETMQHTPRPSYLELLQNIRGHLQRGGYEQFPMLTSSQQDDVNKPYDITGNIVANKNAQVGRIQTRRHIPKQQWADNDPFNEMEDTIPTIALSLAAFMLADDLGDMFDGGFGDRGGDFFGADGGNDQGGGFLGSLFGDGGGDGGGGFFDFGDGDGGGFGGDGDGDGDGD